MGVCARSYAHEHVQCYVYFLMFVFVMRGLAFHLKSSKWKKVFVAHSSIFKWSHQILGISLDYTLYISQLSVLCAFAI